MLRVNEIEVTKKLAKQLNISLEVKVGVKRQREQESLAEAKNMQDALASKRVKIDGDNNPENLKCLSGQVPPS